MQLTHDDYINLIEMVKSYVECELEDEEEVFSDWDQIILKLYSHIKEFES